MKLASIFFTASAQYLRGLPQRWQQISEKYEACFNIFYSECTISWRFTSKMWANESLKPCLLQYFLQRMPVVLTNCTKISSYGVTKLFLLLSSLS